MDRKKNACITYTLLVPTIFSATVLFSLAEIQINTLPKAAIYCTSLSGFFYLYLSATTFALKISKSKSSSGQSLT
jgi:hypothetical protein